MHDRNEAVAEHEPQWEAQKVEREGLGDRLGAAVERHRKELHVLAQRLSYVTSQAPESDVTSDRAHEGYSSLAEAVMSIQEMTEYVIGLGQRIEL